MTAQQKQAEKYIKEADKIKKAAQKFLENSEEMQKKKLAKYKLMKKHEEHLRNAGLALRRHGMNPEKNEAIEEEVNEHIQRANETRDLYKRKREPKEKKDEDEGFKAVKEAVAKKKGKAEKKEEEEEKIEIKVPKIPTKGKKQAEEEKEPKKKTREEKLEELFEDPEYKKRTKAIGTIQKFGSMVSKRLKEGKEEAKKVIGKFIGEAVKKKRVQRGTPEANAKMEFVRSHIKKGIEKAVKERDIRKEKEMMGAEDVKAQAIEKKVRPLEKGAKFMKEAGSVMKRVAEIESAKPKAKEPKKRAPKLKEGQKQMTLFAKKKEEESESESDEEKPADPYGFKTKKKMKFYN